LLWLQADWWCCDCLLSLFQPDLTFNQGGPKSYMHTFFTKSRRACRCLASCRVYSSQIRPSIREAQSHTCIYSMKSSGEPAGVWLPALPCPALPCPAQPSCLCNWPLCVQVREIKSILEPKLATTSQIQLDVKSVDGFQGDALLCVKCSRSVASQSCIVICLHLHLTHKHMSYALFWEGLCICIWLMQNHAGIVQILQRHVSAACNLRQPSCKHAL